MKKQYYIIIILALLILSGTFYWYELRPLSIKKDCFTKADTTKQNTINADNNAIMSGRLGITETLELTKRADSYYDKIFNDEYKKCLMENGIKE